MNRNDIARLLINARSVTWQDDFVVVGSMSVLGKTPSPPAAMVNGTDIDIFPLVDPELFAGALRDRLGIGSDFHREHHYYADPVSPWLSTLPVGWQQRQQVIDVAPDLRARFIDVNDAAVSKYARGNSRDRAWIRAGLEAGLLSLPIIEQRFDETVMEPDERLRARSAAEQDRAWLKEAGLVIAPQVQTATEQDYVRDGRKLLGEIFSASQQFKRHVERGQLKLGSFYLTEYDRAIQRAATAALDGNNVITVAALHNHDLQAAIEKMQHHRGVIASTPRLHLDFDRVGDDAEAPAATAEGKTRRKMLDKQSLPLDLLYELYEGVTRTDQQVPIGALHRHAEARLQQSYAVLVLVEQARDAGGIIPQGATFIPTGAKVQDKTTTKEYPAAHRLPCDLSIRDLDGSLKRLSDFFNLPVDRLWIDKHVFAPTDKVHRLANVVDRWCEEAGMVDTLAEAATAVARRQMSAGEAMTRILEPGYRSAVEMSLDRLESNFSDLERQELRRRLVDSKGQAYDRLPAPLVLHAQGLAERAVAKDLMERTLRAYSAVTELPTSTRMSTAITVSAIVENEQRMRKGPMRVRQPAQQLPFAMARAKASGAMDDAKAWLDGEHARIGSQAGAVRALLDRAADRSLPRQERHMALAAAETGARNVELAWAALIDRDGPEQARALDAKTAGCGDFAAERRAEFADMLRHVPEPILTLPYDFKRRHESITQQLHEKGPTDDADRALGSVERFGMR